MAVIVTGLGLLKSATPQIYGQQLSTSVELGQDFAIYRTVTTQSEATGAGSLHTNQFTLLENHLNYLDNGQWKPSEDLIEAFPGGAVAKRGPNKARYSTDRCGFGQKHRNWNG